MKKIFQKITQVLKIKDKWPKLSPPVKDLLIGISVGALIALISALGVFQKFENLTLDGAFRLRGLRSTNPHIAIVGIDDKSLEILGRWPWPRDYHATFLEILNAYNPRFIVFDILFPEADPGGDAALALTAKEGGNLYLASYFVLAEHRVPASDSIPTMQSLAYEIKDGDKFLHASEVTLPVKPLMDTARNVSIVNAPPDIEGSTRHLPLFIEFGGKLYPTLSLQLACDYLGINMDEVVVKPGAIVLPLKDGDIRIPIDSRGRMVLNYSGPIDTLEQYSYIQLLHDYNRALKEERKSILENINEKIVFVGQTATGSVDLRIMPFSNFYPAVGIHATALSNILDRDFMRKAPAFSNILIILFVSALLGLSVKRGKRMFFNLSVMLILFFSYAVLSFLLFTFLNFWVNTFSPLIAILLAYVAISINHYETVRYEKKILESELLIARQIQQSFLPKSYPKIPFLEFAARCNPAKHVGGDLYDFVNLGNERYGVVIGDVSGKGVPAALYMARAISEVRTVSHIHDDAATTLATINDVFAKEGMEKAFITMQYLMVDLKSKNIIVFSNGGHNTVLHFKKEAKKIEEIDTKGGMPIGLMEGVDFENKEIHFDRGDILFLYSDGISEAMDKRHKEFGLDRVKEILTDNSGLKAEEIMERMFVEIAIFSKGAPQHDDMTMVVIKAI
jgi:serine phosphatase RsbU (regulator of sigma subunit)